MSEKQNIGQFTYNCVNYNVYVTKNYKNVHIYNANNEVLSYSYIEPVIDKPKIIQDSEESLIKMINPKNNCDGGRKTRGRRSHRKKSTRRRHKRKIHRKLI